MKIKKLLLAVVTAALTLSIGACASSEKNAESTDAADKTEATAETTAAETAAAEKKAGAALTFIGHSSVKIKTSDGKVIYIDPAYSRIKDAYSEPADLILVTHQHDDHNRTSLVTQGDGCTVITNAESHPTKEEYKSFEVGDIKIVPVPAENKNHSIDSCVGYLVSFDGFTVYHAGDTSTLSAINDAVKDCTIDYAMYPIDGTYNMDAAEATEFANSIGAANNIPMHIDGVSSEYNEEKAKTFTPNGAMYIKYGDTIDLA